MVEIAINPALMAASLSEIVANLPTILQAVQIVTYIGFIFFFGFIVVLGFRIYAPFWKRMLLRIGFGALSLFSGSAIAGFMPLPDSIIVTLFQLDTILGGIVSAIVFAVSVFLITKVLSSEETIKGEIAALQEELKKEQSRHKPKNKLASPYFLSGMVLIALMLIFSAANFSGFPSFQNSIMSTFGLTQEDLESVSGVLEGVEDMDIPPELMDMPSECYSILNTISTDPGFLDGLSGYTNQQLKTKIEQESGEAVIDMKRAEVGGNFAVVAITGNGKTCIATENDLCVCR